MLLLFFVPYFTIWRIGSGVTVSLLFTSFSVTFANPFKIRFANGICSHQNHFLTGFAAVQSPDLNSNIVSYVFRFMIDSISNIPYTLDNKFETAAAQDKEAAAQNHGIPAWGGRRMKCPFCNQDNTRVVDSRPADDNNSIRRRRLCDACGKRFTTYEKVETIPLIVIKKDEMREQYDRSKIEDGVMRACYKRPIPIQKIKEMIDDVEMEIFNREEREIESKVIGEIVMEKLKDLDAVAYVRFASVYREFKDVNTFMDELKKFLE